MDATEKVKGELFTKEDILCLKLSGTPYEIGYQHGKLLKEHVQNGIYKYFNDYLLNIIRSDRRVSLEPIAKLALKYLKTKSLKFVNRLPIDIKEEIKGLAEGAELKYESALEVFVFPEIMNYLLSRFTDESYAFKTHLSGAFVLGCTSIVATSDATQTGELIHGRNLDFMGVDYWDKYTTVFYVQPNSGFKYISVGSAGLSPGIVTAINEKEISFALHQNYTKEFSENNLPVLALGNLIMKYADNLEKAKEIIMSSKSNSGWSVIVSDNKTKNAFIAEICTDNISFIEMERDLLVYTNSYLSEKFHNKEAVISPLLNISSNIRYQRINQLSGKDYYNINVPSVISYLGDRYDITSEKERIFGYTISQNNTVGSCIFVPDKNKLWVANGSTPVSNNKYIRLDFDFDENKKDTISIEANKFSKESDSKAMQLVMKANSEYCKKNYDECSSLLYEASKICGKEEPNIYFLCSLLYLKLNKFRNSIKYLQLAYENENDIYKAGVIKLWSGRVYDLLDNRDKALKNYRYVEQMDKNIYHDLVELAKKGYKKKYERKFIKNLSIDVWFGEEIVLR